MQNSIKLLEDELSEKAWQEEREREQAEHEAESQQDAELREQELREHEELCARELRLLRSEAEDYQNWERAQLKRAMTATEPTLPRKRCVLTFEAATGSMDRPRVVHTLALDVPVDGDPVVLTLKAQMEPEPEDVPTVAVPSPVGEGDNEAQESVQVQMSSPVQPYPLMDFADYEKVYRTWRAGQMTLEGIGAQYGPEVQDLLQAQFAAAVVEDEEMDEKHNNGDVGNGAPAAEGRATELGLCAQGPACGGATSEQRGRITRVPVDVVDAVQSRWQAGAIADATVVQIYGARWLLMFQLWRDEGQAACRVKFPDLVDWVDSEGSTDRTGSQAGGHEGVETPAVEIQPTLEFDDYQHVYQLWRHGEVTATELECKYGKEVVRMMQDQRDAMQLEGTRLSKMMGLNGSGWCSRGVQKSNLLMKVVLSNRQVMVG